MPDLKRCTKCKVEKPLSEFHSSKTNSDGFSYFCKVCKRKQERQRLPTLQDRRGANLSKKYGWDLFTYNLVLQDQGGCCAICQRPEADSQNGVLHVDHCHETNMVRALLCGDCNRGVGCFHNNSDALKAAADYVIKYREKHERQRQLHERIETQGRELHGPDHRR